MIGLRSPSALAFLLAAALVTACDDEFTPLAPTQLQFSVFGYLDANADTQWVRVMPIRPLILTSPDSFGAVVTLENLGTGEVIALRDSVFRFTSSTHPELGSEGLYAHNFWTTAPIEAGATYRFVVQREGEDASEATVKIPDDYDIEVRIAQDPSAHDFILLEGLKHVAFAGANGYFYDECGSSSHSVPFRRMSVDGDVYTVTADRPEIPERGSCGTPIVERMELWGAASETRWPSGLIQATWGLAVPEGESNISNALGFFGGVLVRRVPYETCDFVGGGPTPAHCALRYDESTATLRGTVREVRCNDGALDSVTVTLRELDREPIAHRRIRENMTIRSGAFEISALEPGMRYALRVRARPEPDPFWGEVDIHSIHTDTVQFAPGEERQYDVNLERFTAC